MSAQSEPAVYTKNIQACLRARLFFQFTQSIPFKRTHSHAQHTQRIHTAHTPHTLNTIKVPILDKTKKRKHCVYYVYIVQVVIRMYVYTGYTYGIYLGVLGVYCTPSNRPQNIGHVCFFSQNGSNVVMHIMHTCYAILALYYINQYDNRRVCLIF